jgi:chromosome partitioning protein
MDSREESGTMRVITISNEKGGVGKTSTAVNLAAAFGLTGQRVLVIDLDTQAHATQWFGIPLARVQSERSAYAVLTGQTAPAHTILRTSEDGVLLCAAHPFLAKAAKELSEQVDGIFHLRDALDALVAESGSSDLDTVIIDCPPARGVVVFNALLAADLIIAPVLAEALSVQGLIALDETVRRIKQRYSPDLALPFILLNNYEGRAIVDRQLHDDLQQQYGDRVLTTEIGRDAPLREAFLVQASIFRHRRSARSASQFQALADEIMRYLYAE